MVFAVAVKEQMSPVREPDIFELRARLTLPRAPAYIIPLFHPVSLPLSPSLLSATELFTPYSL